MQNLTHTHASYVYIIIHKLLILEAFGAFSASRNNTGGDSTA